MKETDRIDSESTLGLWDYAIFVVLIDMIVLSIGLANQETAKGVILIWIATPVLGLIVLVLLGLGGYIVWFHIQSWRGSKGDSMALSHPTARNYRDVDDG